MTEEKKCFICQKSAVQEFVITIDDGGKLNNTQQEKTYICNTHLREFEYIKKKKRPKVDFH